MEKKVVFVDCFNTIICRDLSPRDVIFLWAKELGNKFDIEPSVIFNLYNKFEKKLFLRNKLNTGEGEYKFTEVIDKVADLLEHANCGGGSFQNFIDNALELYIEVERKHQYLNDEIVNCLKQFKSEGNKVYIVSDFYCGKDVLKIWLNSHGILDLFDDIFVSCDYGKSKRTGRLYKLIIKELNLNKKEIMMIGDSRRADVIMARKAGIHARKVNSKPNGQSKELNTFAKYGANYFEQTEIFKEFGKEYNLSNYAFPLYLFNKRLYAALKENKAKNVFFMAREGQYLKKLFDKYCEINGFEMNTHYFYVSRNTALMVSLSPIEEEDFYLMLRHVFNMNVRRFLLTLNFTEEEIEKIASETKINIKKRSTNFTKSKEFKALKQNELFRKLYDEKRNKEKEAFKLYIDSFNVDYEKEGMHLVDVGWYGTIQDEITKYFNKRVITYGYYIGKFEKTCNPYSIKNALFYSRPSNHIYGNRMLRHRRLDYEQLCRADHNRVKGYKVQNGKCEIVLSNEFDENKIWREYIKPIQDQMSEKFEKLCKLDYKYGSTCEDLTLKMFYKMFTHQSHQDWQWLYRVEYQCYDSFARIGLKQFRLRLLSYKFADFWFKIAFYGKVKSLKFCKK